MFNEMSIKLAILFQCLPFMRTALLSSFHKFCSFQNMGRGLHHELVCRRNASFVLYLSYPQDLLASNRTSKPYKFLFHGMTRSNPNIHSKAEETSRAL
jgi:hypothetical protein